MKIYPCIKCGGINSLVILQTYENNPDETMAIFKCFECTCCGTKYFYDRTLKRLREVLNTSERRWGNLRFKELYTMQMQLNNKIAVKCEETYTNQELLNMDLLELNVEAGELANAIKSFKYWNKKKNVSKEHILDEYADVLHALLSVALRLDLNPHQIIRAFKEKQLVNLERQDEGY